MKKAKEFLLDTQLGAESYQMEAPKKGGAEVTLDIEKETVPIGVLERKAGAQLRARESKGVIQRINEALAAAGRVKPKHKAAFFRLLAIMVDAGISVVQSLHVIGEQTLNVKLRKAIFRMAEIIEQGGNLSAAMQQFPRLFTHAETGMVQSGEASGKLNNVLKELAKQVEKAAGIQQKVKSAMIYPTVIFIALVLVVSAMMIWVVPRMTEIFSTTGAELPNITQWLIATSEFLQTWWVFLAIGLIVFIVFIILIRRTERGRYGWDWLIIHLPLFGKLVKKSVLARFTRTLANLLASGIPIIKALQIDALASGNAVYRERIMLAAEDLSKGIPLGENMRDSPLFPQLIVQMVSVGEQTANLDTIALKVADYYEDEVDNEVQGLSKAFEPLILIVVGVTVGGIVAAIMLPIIQLIALSEVL